MCGSQYDDVIIMCFVWGLHLGIISAPHMVHTPNGPHPHMVHTPNGPHPSWSTPHHMQQTTNLSYLEPLLCPLHGQSSIFQGILGIHCVHLRTQAWSVGIHQGTNEDTIIPVCGEVFDGPVGQLLLQIRTPLSVSTCRWLLYQYCTYKC